MVVKRCPLLASNASPRVFKVRGTGARFAEPGVRPPPFREGVHPYHADPAATGHNPRQRFRLLEPFSRRSDLPLVATGCARSALSEEGPLVKLSSLVSPPGCGSRTDAQLFLGANRTPCRWELSRLLNSIRGRQAAKAKRELAGTEGAPVRGAGLKGWLRESMCQAAIRILRATAALAELWLRERPATSR